MAWEAKIQELEKRLSEAAETRLFRDFFFRHKTRRSWTELIEVDWGFELQ